MLMKKHSFSLLSFAVAFLFLFTTACTSVRVNQSLSPEQTTVVQKLSSEIENTPMESVAAAQTSEETTVQPTFSASEAYTKAIIKQDVQKDFLAENPTPATQENVRALREQVRHQKMSVSKKVLLNTVLKKLEKAQNKLDVKQAKAAKKGKAIPDEYRTPFLIALVGLIVAIVFSIAYVPVLSVLGWLAFVGGCIWMLLIYLGEA